MAIRLSNGLASSMLGNYGFMAMMNYGYIEVYEGDQPISPNEPPSSVLLGTITTSGTPFVVGSTGGGALQLVQADSGVLGKGGIWTLVGIAAGVAGWWRWKWNSFDDGAQSFFYPRMDGLVGESLILADTNITTSTSVEIENFLIQFRG